MIGRIITSAVVVFAAGCTGHGGEYRDGARLPPAAEPRTAYAPAGAGLPEYWARPEAESPPRSPHKRVLPPEKGPGIWAGDEARGSLRPPPMRKTGDPIPDIKVLGVPVPHHPDAKDGLDTAPTEQCAGANQNVLMAGDMALARRAGALSAEQRSCLVAMAQYDCMLDLYEALLKVDAPLAPRARMALDVAKDWAHRACEAGHYTPEVRRILEGMTDGNSGGRAWEH